MKRNPICFLTVLVTVFFLLTSQFTFAQDNYYLGNGSDGALIVSNGSFVTPSVCSRLTSAAPIGQSFVTVASTTGFAVGDLIMVLQATGLTGQTSGNQSNITLNGNVGQYELKRVTALTSTRLTFTGSALTNAYLATNAQVVSVKEYTTVNVQSGGSISAANFDGLQGGIIAFLATGAVTINGTVGVNGLGPVGGSYGQSVTGTYTSLDATSSTNAGRKGYGVALLTSGTTHGYGNQANGGGGGNANNGGGGGGANAGKGGNGGMTSGNGANEAYGGLGGASLTYSPVSRLVFGGSGGAGHGVGTSDNFSSIGGAGGGIIWVRAASIDGSGQINAGGGSGHNAQISAGGGGGGAGGTICLRASGTIASSLIIRAMGGDGGLNFTANVAPGGGGGGGRIYVQAAGYSGAPIVNGGVAGNDTNNSLFGASGGYVGEVTINTDGLVNPATPVLTSPLANATVNTLKPNITGTATAGSTVSIYIDNVLNGTATTDGSGNFSYTPAVDLSEGTHSIAAQAELVGLTTARTTGYNFTTVVTPVAPTNILLSATAVNENVVTGTTVATLSSTDANGSDTFTYSLISGTGDTDNATFSIAGNQLNINVSPDFETKSTYSIRIRTTDSGNLTFEKSFTIAINNVVEAPTTITLTPASFPENVSFGTVVGTLNVDGDFYSARDFFLTLGGTGSDDNGLFGMRDEGNGIFKLYWGSATPPDFEGLHGSIYKIRIVYYQNVTSLERPLTLMLTNVDEAPTDLSLSANSINENVVANSTIGTFTTTDADGGDTFTYSLVSGDGASDNGSFTIDGNALKIVPSPDFETKNSYSIRVRTTDASGKTFDKIFAITINDVQEAVITVGGTLSNFAAIQGSASAAQSFTVAGTGLTEGILVTSPSGYEVSKDNSTFSTTVTVGSAGTVATTTIYVRLSAAATIGSYNGNIQITSAGAQSRQFGLVGTVSLAKRYVTTTGAGTKDGSSWANASDDLRNALLSSIAGGEVWVAKGTYKPTSTTDRTINFSIPNGVAVYGGFAGTETATDQRNIKLNPTVLSGDIGIPGNNMDNSYHLFLIQSNTLPTTLDGFTITDGSSIGMASGIHSEGAGLLISNVRDLSLKNLIITKNTSSNEGGGVYIYHNTSGSNTITFTQVSFIQNKGLNYGGGGLNISGTQTATINLDRCIFDGNLVLSTNGSVGTGGAIQIESPNAIAALTNCLFVNNRAGGQGDDGGGAIMNYGGTVSVTNSTLYNNTTGSTSFPDGNSLSIASTGAINVINSIIWGTAAKHINKPSGAINLTNSLVKGEMVSSPNLNSDPLFVNTNNLTGADGLFGTADDGLNLRYSSPAKNNGTANNAPNIDLAGTARPQGAAIDMGAYETNSPQPVISNTTANGLTAVYGSAPIAGSFNLSGTGMDAGILVTAPANFEVSLNMSSGFADAITVGTGDNIFAPVYVRLKSDLSAGSYAGNIVLTSLSATSVNVAVSCTNSKAGLTITAKNINKTYGTALMALTGSTEFTSTGLQNSETIGTVSIAYGDGADAAGTVGTHTGAVTASDAIGGTFNPANYDITYVAGNIIIDAPLIAVIPASLSSGTVAAPYHAALTASGGIGTYTFNVTTGSLPAGITLAADGTLSGTPTAGGSFTFTVTATDGSLSGGPYTGSQVYVWVVSPPAISITNTSLPIGAVGTTYSQTIMASGGTVPYSYGVTAGALPPGITLASDGTLSGTPTGEGTYNCTITAFDSSTGTGAPYSGSRAFSLTIAPPNVQIATLTLASGTVGEAYTQTLIAAGGTPAYTYTVTAGMLPMGLNLATNGVLSGTPTTKGTFNVTITARDASGTGPYAGSRAYAITIGAGAQVITFSPIADQTYGAAPITLNASSSAGITVTFNSSNTNVATITNNILSIVGAGSTTITASQIGDNNYNAATDVQQTLNVGKASQAITFNTLADQTFGDAAFDLNATGGASGNAITYTISNTNVATITGNKVTIIGAGTTTIQASQAGNANYNAASDVGQTLNVGKAPQAITFPVLANKSVGDAPFDLNATAGASGNAITYTISNTNVATITGNKVTIIGAGTTTIQASQAGNANYNAAADVQQALNVGKAQQAITFASLADKTFGDAAFDLTASGGASGNAVSYASSNNNVATINGNKVTIMGAGSIKITASQAGNGNYHAASDVEQTLNIGKASQAITFTALADKTFGDTDFNLTASGGSSGNTITYSSSNTNVATISGNKVTIVGAGTTTITASQAGSANYSAAADVQQTLNVGKASQNITFSTLADKTFGDANFTLNVTGGGSANQVGFISSDPQVATVSGNQITIVGAGTVSITATQAGDGNYDAATPVTRTFSVAKATATITLGNLVQVYDGSPKSVAMVTNPAGLSGLMVSYNGSPDLPVVAGNYQVVATLINGNYMASPATAVLVIEKATATLTLGNLSQVYDGTPKTVGITTSPAHLSSVAITYNGSSSLPIGAGTYAVVAQLNDPNYTANLVSANLVIGKAAAILHIGNLVQTYDGAPKSVLVTTNPVGLSGTSITYNGSSVAPTAAGTYNVVVTLTNADYSASILASTLTVNPQPVTVTATAKHITYGDADPLLTYISAPVLAVGDRFTGALSRTAGSQAGTYPIILNDLTAGPNYMINYVAANLTIDKKPLLITADNKTRNFNVANPVLTASFNGFIPGETNAVLLNQPVLTTTATQNSATGTYPIQVGVANADNYIISYAPGTLTIVPTAQSIAFSALPDRLSTDGTFNLTASSSAGLAISYQSSDPSVARIINVNQVEILKAGIVTITASQAGDANFTAATSVSQQLRIIDNPPPILAIISSLGNSISKGEITKLTVSGANSYVWSNADGIISGQTTATLTVRPFTTTTYTVTGKNQYGRSSSKNITIEVRPDLQAVSVAPSATNIISPNGDGVNDFFVVNNIDAYPNNSVVIFDRTGKTLYKVKSYKNDWDGRVNGLLLEEGTYYYIIEFGDGKTNAIKGFITIVKE